MPDVTTFNLGGQDITVKDPTARSNAQSDTSLVVIGTNCIISIHALLAESD